MIINNISCLPPYKWSILFVTFLFSSLAFLTSHQLEYIETVSHASLPNHLDQLPDHVLFHHEALDTGHEERGVKAPWHAEGVHLWLLEKVVAVGADVLKLLVGGWVVQPSTFWWTFYGFGFYFIDIFSFMR